MKKRIFALLISIVILAGIPENVFAENIVSEEETRGFRDGDFGYLVNEELTQAQLISYYGTDKEIHIPETIGNGLEVVSLCGMFDEWNSSGIEAVYIPKTVTDRRYMEGLFTDMPQLKAIYVDKENPVFWDRDGVLFMSSAVESMEEILMAYPEAKAGETYRIPQTTFSMFPLAFYKSQNLRRIIVPESVADCSHRSFFGTQAEIIFASDQLPHLFLSDCFYNLEEGSKIVVRNDALAEQIPKYVQWVDERDYTKYEPEYASELIVSLESLTEEERAAYVTPTERLTFADGTTEKQITLAPGERFLLRDAYCLYPSNTTDNVTWKLEDGESAYLTYLEYKTNGYSFMPKADIYPMIQAPEWPKLGMTTFVGTDESGHSITLHVRVNEPIEDFWLVGYTWDGLVWEKHDEPLENMCLSSGEECEVDACTVGYSLNATNITFESSNPDVAVVEEGENIHPWKNTYDSYENTLKVKALSAGTATITVTLDDDGTLWKKSFVLTVTEEDLEDDENQKDTDIKEPSKDPASDSEEMTKPENPSVTDGKEPDMPKTDNGNQQQTNNKPATGQDEPIKEPSPAEKKVVINSVKSKKASQFTVKWKKVKNVKGYQIQYSANKKFKKAKAVMIKKNTTTSKTVKKVVRGRKYYVRIRPYQVVQVNGKKMNKYGTWSKVQTVKVKK